MNSKNILKIVIFSGLFGIFSIFKSNQIKHDPFKNHESEKHMSKHVSQSPKKYKLSETQYSKVPISQR